MMNKQEFYNKVTEQTGIELSEKQKNQYQRYYELVVEWNQKINLTSYARIILSYAVSGYLDSVFFGIGGENSSIAIKSSSKKYTGNTSAPSEEIVLDISNVSGEQDIYIYLDTPNAGELNGTKITGTCTIKSIIAYITD